MVVVSPARRVVLRAAVAVSVMALAAGCGPSRPSFQGSDISGTNLGRGLRLTDHNGQLRTIDDFKGKVVVAFFGFAQCPDVCPTALAELAQVMKNLGPDADKVQVLMITVDPERDTQEVLKQYVTAFDPRFLGLRGDAQALKQTADSFKAYYARAAGSSANYSMDHTAAFYILDQEGSARVLANNTIGAPALEHDIKALL